MGGPLQMGGCGGTEALEVGRGLSLGHGAWARGHGDVSRWGTPVSALTWRRNRPKQPRAPTPTPDIAPRHAPRAALPVLLFFSHRVLCSRFVYPTLLCMHPPPKSCA